ncbi:hypothetical protein LTR36_008712 [Oleoguttula mirabilis]|uniref:Uncharacterized protein n=1 Tax=Oleoguttula mirabilis TaxID=1507867 RepID=A0AAV9JWG7_9PEZI|nr:hypothetical protein LTR36_008712 [Oleoguttula mirabilis]
MIPRAGIDTRSSAETATSATISTTCVELHDGEIVISRTTLITAITICIFITCLSILLICALLYRACARRRQAKAAKAWGRKSTYNHRISHMQKQLDQEYSRQYSGCLHNDTENPFLGSDSPVELMLPERIWEAPAVPAKVAGKDRRKSKISLFFDDAVGLWVSRK